MALVFEKIMERTTDVVAVAAVASPWWITSLSYFSQASSALLPVLGCVWLLTQIISHWRYKNRIEEFVRAEGSREGKAEVRKEAADLLLNQGEDLKKVEVVAAIVENRLVPAQIALVHEEVAKALEKEKVKSEEVEDDGV